MPVWHEKTRAWRESGRLVVLGITQEQHAERCRLFAQWQGIDWPILWDPFNTTGSKAVPRFTLIDEHGIVRSLRARVETIREEFLDRTWEVDPQPIPPRPRDLRTIAALDLEPSGERHAFWTALSDLLWRKRGGAVTALQRMETLLALRPDDAAAHFQVGVARRMRHDSGSRRPGDFQRAIDAWMRALELVPGNYIWRRRIQQYGPRLDKPYPFYDWVETARAAIRERGEEPIALPVAPSGAEVAAPAKRPDAGAAPAATATAPAAAATHPDPEGRVPRDELAWLDLDVTVAPHTGGGRAAVRVHLTFAPRPSSDRHWNNEAGAPRLWVALPKGWSPGTLLIEGRQPADHAVSDEPRTFEFEARAPADTDPGAIATGVLFFNACGDDGVCTYLRRDVEFPLRR